MLFSEKVLEMKQLSNRNKENVFYPTSKVLFNSLFFLIKSCYQTTKHDVKRKKANSKMIKLLVILT